MDDAATMLTKTYGFTEFFPVRLKKVGKRLRQRVSIQLPPR